MAVLEVGSILVLLAAVVADVLSVVLVVDGTEVVEAGSLVTARCSRAVVTEANPAISPAARRRLVYILRELSGGNELVNRTEMRGIIVIQEENNHIL